MDINLQEERQGLGVPDEAVAVRAYELYEQRLEQGDSLHGFDVDDWHLAEAQLIDEANEGESVFDVLSAIAALQVSQLDTEGEQG